ncbi:MAG TPA: hypothetical protein VHM91_08120 [Verrucomicrobiales bacterium]|nr:hypothetical protein [Verrucomicrobiales bacterium]
MKLVLVSALIGALLSSAGARTFTSQKGQTIEGSLTSVDAINAVITKGDGQKVTVPLKLLAEADQKFCADWRTANPVIKLTVKADSVTAAGSRKSGTSQSSSSSSSMTEKSRVSEEGYRITVSNWSKDPGTKVAGLTVRYAIVIGFFDTAAKEKRGVKNIVHGSADIPELTGSKPQSVLTQTVKVGQSAAVATRTTKDSSGDSTTSEAAAVYRESVDGICFVVKQGDRVLSTYSTGKVPKDLPGKLLK